MMDVASWLAPMLTALAMLATLCGLAVVVAGGFAVRRFAHRTLPPGRYPPVTVLKPLCGDEPLLEAALASICGQRYPEFQIVFGVQDPADPALHAVRRLQARYPHCDIAVVVESASHGPNRKVCNLINMLPASRHDVLVFSDSDLHVAPDYLERVVAELEVPGTGLVTTLCSGRATMPGLGARLGAMHITHSFVPGALLARAFGRQDCLGTTMALHRDTLRRIGGLEILAGLLAEDNFLGQRVRQLGLAVGLAGTVPATGVPEASVQRLWQHELRWARTIGALEPLGFAASALQYPTFWAGLACLLSQGASWTIALLATAWLVRAAGAMWVDHELGFDRAVAVRPWLLPVRDMLSVVEVAASFLGAQVIWRGNVMRADTLRAAEWIPEPQVIGMGMAGTLEAATLQGD